MLKIRKEQYEELGKISLKKFEDSMVEHIKEFFPENYDALGEPVVRNVIKYGVDRAEAHGFETEPDVNMYIDLMFLLGSHFDTDPQLPWAAAILEDETIADSAIRVEKLYDQADEYLDRVEGPDDEHLTNALDEFSDISFEELLLTRSEDIQNITMSLLRRIWPEKCQVVGHAALRNLIRYGEESTQRHRITSQRGVVLYTVLMFMLG
ncbi:MAG: hypothetical protein RQ760_16195, partial [Sedimentisphaerales bacterium]|nr:hypothetical protein [Sedimentisphaerales bacterium]